MLAEETSKNFCRGTRRIRFLVILSCWKAGILNFTPAVLSWTRFKNTIKLDPTIDNAVMNATYSRIVNTYFYSIFPRISIQESHLKILNKEPGLNLWYYKSPR